MPRSFLDAAHVRVDGQHVTTEREVADGAGGVRPDPGQRGQVVGPAVRGDVLRGSMQVDGATVVAEPLPRDDHVGDRGGGERLGGGPALEPRRPARDHALDLRLLQHHLADEDRVRVTRLAPREWALVLAVPRQKRRLHGSERRRGSGRNVAKGRADGLGAPETEVVALRQPQQQVMELLS